MLVAGPQRRLFFACVLVGFASLLSLDLHFAPASLAANEAADAAPSSGSSNTLPSSDAGPHLAARVVIPAPARVPTIVARFDTASKEPVDQTAIRALATAMIEDHDVTIVLEGHSDTRGGDDYNHKISLERADWVKGRLVELGVSAERIETVGLGATRPLRSDDPDAPSVNRRVEVRWLGNVAREIAPPPKTPPKIATAIATASAPQPKTTRREASAAQPAAPAEPPEPSTAASETPALAAPDASVRITEGSSHEESPRSPPGPTGGESPQPGDD